MFKISDYFQLVNYLKSEKLTIATAESCTGGLIAKLITDVAGSSEVFLGCIVSYSNEMKSKWLGVKEKTLINFGAVSEETVSEMLDGIIMETGAHIGVAVSGIAGPGGGTTDKPVGTVYIGVLFPKKKVVEKCFFQGTREEVRVQSANKIVEMIQEIINY
jgi:PncC family amidohydrolase